MDGSVCQEKKTLVGHYKVFSWGILPPTEVRG